MKANLSGMQGKADAFLQLKERVLVLSLSETGDSIVRRALNLLLIWIRAPGVSLSWWDEGVSRTGGSGAHLLFVN